MELEIPHLGIISFNNAWTTFGAFFIQVEKASTHSEEVYTTTRRYLSFLLEVISLFL
jgi:hypothetical protein